MNVRNYIQFVRINHPFVFNAKLLTVMIVPCKKKNKWKKEKVFLILVYNTNFI